MVGRTVRRPRRPRPWRRGRRVAAPRTGPHPQPAQGGAARAHPRRHARRRDPPPRPPRGPRSTAAPGGRRPRVADGPLPGRQHRRRRRQRPDTDADPRRPRPVPVVRHPHQGAAMNTTTENLSTTFATDPSGLDDRVHSAIVALADGDTFELRIGAVAHQLGDDRVRMLAYNGSIPGPTLRVRQGSEITVHVHNDADTDATVHWHGLRLDNAYDGVPHETQAPIPVGGEFSYRLRFPDAGLYWYHPHIREDYGLDMGLYGNIVVDPTDHDYWPPVSREHVVTVDDVLVEDGQLAPFHVDGPTHVAMGRFGNVMLTAGETNLE